MQSETPQGTPMPEIFHIPHYFEDSDNFDETRINDSIIFMLMNLNQRPSVGDIIRVPWLGDDHPGFWVQVIQRIVIPYHIEGLWHLEKPGFDYTLKRVETPPGCTDYEAFDEQNEVDDQFTFVDELAKEKSLKLEQKKLEKLQQKLEKFQQKLDKRMKKLKLFKVKNASFFKAAE